MPDPRSAPDVYQAVADAKRREILVLLARERGRERAVGEIVEAVRLPQPDVSKRLGMLRRAGLVSARRRGQHRLYAIRAEALKPVNEWIQIFEPLWSDQLQRIRDQAESRAKRTKDAAAAQRPSKERET